MPSFAARFASPPVRLVRLAVYYAGILLALAYLYGQGDFRAPDFVYQGF